MKEFEEIQRIWQGQPPESDVSFETILKRIKDNKAALSTKLFWQLVAVGLVIVVALWIGITVDFLTWTSYLALAIIVGCICYYFFNQIGDYRNISNSDHQLSKPQDYISYLKTFQKKRNRFNTRNYAIYEVCIALAFALYGIELYFIVPFWTFVGFTVFSVFWFLICHFVFMKQYIKHENARIQEMIDNLERIKEQFENE